MKNFAFHNIKSMFVDTTLDSQASAPAKRVGHWLSHSFTLQVAIPSKAALIRPKKSSDNCAIGPGLCITTATAAKALIAKVIAVSSYFFFGAKLDTSGVVREFADKAKTSFNHSSAAVAIDEQVRALESSAAQLVQMHIALSGSADMSDTLDFQGAFDEFLSVRQTALTDVNKQLESPTLPENLREKLEDAKNKLQAMPSSAGDIVKAAAMAKAEVIKEANTKILLLSTFSRQMGSSSDGSVKASNPAMQQVIESRWSQEKKAISALLQKLDALAPNAPETKALREILSSDNPKIAIANAVIKTRSMENVATAFGSTLIATFGAEQRYFVGADSTQELDGLLESIRLQDPSHSDVLQEVSDIFAELLSSVKSEKEAVNSLFSRSADGSKTLLLDLRSNDVAMQALQRMEAKANQLQSRASTLSVAPSSALPELQRQVISYAQNAVKGVLADLHALLDSIDQRQIITDYVRQCGGGDSQAADLASLLILREASTKKFPLDQVLSRIDDSFVKELLAACSGEKTDEKVGSRVALVNKLRDELFVG